MKGRGGGRVGVGRGWVHKNGVVLGGIACRVRRKGGCKVEEGDGMWMDESGCT